MSERRTAEWVCTRCGTVNRKLVPREVPRAEDRCLSCRTRHNLVPSDRPVRWTAQAA